MLLKGMHDDVKISIVEETDDEEEAKTQKVDTGAAPKANGNAEEESTKEAAPTANESENRKKKPSPMKTKDEYEASLRRQSPQKFTFDSVRGTPTSSPVVSRRKSTSVNKNVYSSPLQKEKSSPLRKDKSSPLCTSIAKRQSSNVSPFRNANSSPQLQVSPIVPRQKQDICGTSSDGEAEVLSRMYPPPPPLGACSDSEADGRVSTPRRGRVKLPSVFLVSSPDGRPPAPWRMRKAKSSMNVTKSPDVSSSPRRKSVGAMSSKPVARKKQPVTQEKEDSNAVDTVKDTTPKLVVETAAVDETSGTKLDEPGSPPNTKENDGPSSNVDSRKSVESRKSTTPSKLITRSQPVKQKSLLLSREASMRVDNEVHQLVKDIRRVGSNPGEPSVTFGELFDDETVQDTYEALVGTLRSAKRQGYIDFKGQMLFKGMHDHVTINVVEQSAHTETVS